MSAEDDGTPSPGLLSCLPGSPHFILGKFLGFLGDEVCAA